MTAVRPTAQRFNSVAIVLHWTIGLGILAMLAMGLAMTHAPIAPAQKFMLYQLHKSVGITILVAAALRLLWRSTHRPPALPTDMPGWEKGAAGGTHVLLYVLMIGMPLVGWLLVSASPLNLPTVLYGRLPWPHIPVTAWFGWSKPQASAVLAWIHAWGGYALIALILLHAGAALRHHLVLRDGVLRRMIPGLPWLGRPPRRPPMMPKLAAAALLLALGGTAEAATWTVDTAKSKLGFSGQQTGTPFTGRFKAWTASIDFDPAHPEAARVTATVDTASATTDDPQKDEALPTPDWFDAADFAKATFDATGFTSKGGDDYATTGKLTLRGTAKDVALPFTLTIAGDQAHAVGHAKLVRTAFGVGQGTWSSGDYVALDVDVDLDLVATKKP